MQPDSKASTPSSNGESAAAELDVLRTRCWQQEHQISSLNDAVAGYRRGNSDLALENDTLRLQVSALLAERRSWNDGLLEVPLLLDEHAPAAARAAVAAALRGGVPPALLERVQLVASELTTNSVCHSGARRDESLLLRIERSQETIRLEVSDPGREGVIAVSVLDGPAPGGFGLRLAQTLCERWGAERTDTGGTRVWAQFTLRKAALQLVD